MSKIKYRRKIQVKQFGDILFATLAPKLLFEDVRENVAMSESLREFSNSILVLSCIYRPVFRENIQSVTKLLARNVSNNPMLYAYTFAEILCNNYTAYKFLVWCSFVSELHFYIFENQAEDKEKSYIYQSSLAFRDIFNLTFDIIFFKKPQRWKHLFWTASKISEKYTLLKSFIEEKKLTESEVISTILQGVSINKERQDEAKRRPFEKAVDESGSAPQMNKDYNLLQRLLLDEDVEAVSTPKSPSKFVKTRLRRRKQNKSRASRSLLLNRKTKRQYSSTESTENTSPANESGKYSHGGFRFSKSKKRLRPKRKRTN